MDAAAATFNDFQGLDTPRWQEPVVLVSMTAIAAAAGFGLLYEAGAAPWLSTTTALMTAAALFAVHRGLRPRPAHIGRDGLGIGRARLSKARAKPAQAADALPLQPHLLQTPPSPSPQAPLPSRPIIQERPSISAPDLAQFIPRQSPVMPAPPAPLAAAMEVKFEQLDALVRQMAASVPGPKAVSPDPDLARPDLAWRTDFGGHATAHAGLLPAVLEVGFGTPALAHTGQRVAEAIAAERVDVLLTPIQSLTEHRASHFEVSIRLRDDIGDLLDDEEVARAARQTSLSGSLDALKLSRVARVARRVQARGGTPADVLADVFGPSLADSDFIAATGANLAGSPPTAIVLALAQSDVRSFGRVHWSALATLGDLGLRFAISEVTDLDMDFELMAARGFVYTKLDAGVFLDGLPLGTVVIPATDVARHLSGCGLTLIVGRIDDEARLEQIAACGVSLGQGALFGNAKPVRQDILTDPPPSH